MKTTVCISCALSITFLTLLSTCQGQQGARFIATPSDSYYVTRGRPANIECEAINVNSISFTCSKDISVQNQKVVARVLNNGFEAVKGTLKVTKQDIQGYSNKSPFWCECIGETISGTPIRSRRSEVKSAYLKKEFIRSPKSKAAPLGSKVEFMCTAPEGGPAPTISWLKDGKKLNVDKDNNLILNSRGMLVFKKLRKRDLGKYSCQARNGAARRISREAELSVGDASVEDRLEASDAPLEDGPFYEKEPDSLYYSTVDTPVEITCKVIGASILTVRCNNRRLLDEEQKKQEIPSGQGKIYETTFSVSEEDIRRYGIDGSYSCYCVSWYTSPGASGWLSKNSARGYVELAFMDEEFVREPESQTTGVSSSVTLACSPPTAKPPAEIKWNFNGAEIDANSRYMVIDDEGSLTIESVEYENAGDYQCSASNVAGIRYSANARLTVQDGFVKKTEPRRPTRPTRPRPEPTTTATPPRTDGTAYFSTPLENVYYLGTSDPVTITCGVKNADMVTFRCNGRRYEQDEIQSEQDYNRQAGKFDITSSIQVTRDDLEQGNGEYRCICTMWFTVSGNWEREESVQAKVEEAFLEEEFALEPVDSQVELGVPAELVCSAPYGGPEPRSSWLRDGVRVVPDNNLDISASGSLTIRSMRRKYVGSYTCVASNSAGVLYSRAASLSVLDSGEVTDSITESILIDGASTAEPEFYTPEYEPSSEPETRIDGGVAHGALPMFTEEPETSYYVIKGQSIRITCSAKNVDRIGYRCSGMEVPEYRIEMRRSDVVRASLELSREDIEGFTDDNSCICDAFYRRRGSDVEESISSRAGYVYLAYIKKRFLKNPEDTSTMEGMMAALPCTPPEALPRPTVYWLFNGQRLDSLLGSNIVQPDDNSLVFVNPTLELAGDYTCVAENTAGRRTSNTARLAVEVPQGGGVVVVPEVDPEAEAEVDTTDPETTAEPEGEPEIATPESEPEPEEGDGYATAEEGYVTKDMQYTDVQPEATTEFMISSYRGIEVAEPTVSVESAKKFKKCQEKMSLCNRYFTQQVRPAEENQDNDAKCRAAAEYSMCVEDFVGACQGEIKDNAINTMLNIRDRLSSSCRDDEGNVIVDTNMGPYQSCNELQECTRHLTEGDSPMFDDTHSACNSLTSMLMCGDSALSVCNIQKTTEQDTSLSTIGEWYSKYCKKVIMERNSFVTCESLRACNTPLNASTSVRDMYDVNIWCPYTHSVIACTMNAVDSCQPEERHQIEADLRMLKLEARGICPQPGSTEEVVDVGQSQNQDENSASIVYSRTSIFLSLIHVVFLLVLSLR